MDGDLEDAGLSRALAELSALGLSSRMAAAMGRHGDDLSTRFVQAVVADIPAFSASANPGLLPDLQRHAVEHAAALRRLLTDGVLRNVGLVRAHAGRRAAQRFPLEAVLGAYRCLQPTLLQWVARTVIPARERNRDQLLSAVADVGTHYAGVVGIEAAAAYVAQTRAEAEAEGDRRNELLNILLSGYDESDARVARLLKRAGYLEQRLSFCVAVAQSTDPLEMESPARAQRIVEAIFAAVDSMPVRALVGTRGPLVTAVFSEVRRVSGWTAPRAALADRIGPPLLGLGPAVLIGVSSDQPSTSFIPRGLHEASVALDLANVAERLVSFSALPIRRLLIHRGADYVQSALPVWFTPLRDADARAQGNLVKTLRGLADADMNVQRAARDLQLHPNTVYARIGRVAELTGLDAQRYHDLTQLLLAADCGRV